MLFPHNKHNYSIGIFCTVTQISIILNYIILTILHSIYYLLPHHVKFLSVSMLCIFYLWCSLYHLKLPVYFSSRPITPPYVPRHLLHLIIQNRKMFGYWVQHFCHSTIAFTTLQKELLVSLELQINTNHTQTYNLLSAFFLFVFLS